MNPLSVSDISSYTPIPIPNVSNPGMINFTDKLNQVIKENKLLQKKTKKSFAEIRAAFGSNKKPQRPKMKITKSPLLNKKINKKQDKNSSEESDESANNAIRNFLQRQQNQNQNQNPNMNNNMSNLNLNMNMNNMNLNMNSMNINMNNMNMNSMNMNNIINNTDDRSTDKSGDKSTSDKSMNNNNTLDNLFQKKNNNKIQEKKEERKDNKKFLDQLNNDRRIEKILEKSVTKLEKPKNKEVKPPENETTETQIDLSVPDPNAPNEIVLDEETAEEIEDDGDNEVVEELESDESEVDLSNVPDDIDNINNKNKKAKIDLNNINLNNPLNPINPINSISPITSGIPIEIPPTGMPIPQSNIPEITPQPIGVNNIISTIPTTIINNPSAVNNITTIPNISTMPNISTIPNLGNISSIPIIAPITKIHDVNSITNNVNLINTINAINEPRKYNKKNKNLMFMNHGINKYNTMSIQKHIKEVNPEVIEKEFYEVMNGQGSAVDRLVYGINFFMDQGFTENVRYVFYENLMNMGLPINGNFNKFYQTFIANCGENQKDIPCKIAAEFYFEFIFKILVDNISDAKQRYISDFFFNGNKYEIIRNNFNLITYVRELIAENEMNLYNFLMDKYDFLFKDIAISNVKINTGFNKYKNIISKMLANVILRCDRHGYLNFRQYIDNERIIFDGLKIKDNNTYGHGRFSVKKMISIKVFGQELTNKKFNDIVKEYFLYLFSHFNYADVMQYK